MVNLLIFGGDGQLGHALDAADRSRPRLTLHRVARAACDVTDRDAVAGALAVHRPDIVLNAAAYTAVDAAETHSDAAFAVNRDGPATLGALCADRGLPLVHISTDYVFDGRAGRPYRETDQTGPLNVYGASKLAGEVALLCAHDRALVIRTAWLFSERPGNFLSTMMRLMRERPQLTIVDDQRGNPTSAHSLADALLDLCVQMVGDTRISGLCHLASPGDASWYEFALAIRDALGLKDACALHPVTSEEFGALARRPADSRLDCRRAEAEFGAALPDWRAALAAMTGRIL